MSESQLLKRAYQLVDQNKPEEAKHILNAIVFKYPNHIEAWEFYLQLCTEFEELDWMANRILESKRIAQENKLEIINYYHYLRKTAILHQKKSYYSINSLWDNFKPALNLVIPLLAILLAVRKIDFSNNLFSAVILIELAIFFFAWKIPKETTQFRDLRKYALDSEFLFKRKNKK